MDLVIVHDKSTDDIAQQLNAIISTIPECQSRVLTENDWNANKMQISSEEFVLFIGNVADGLALKPIIQWKYEKINMKYGWIGKKALMLVEKHTFKKEEVEELKTMFNDPKVKTMNSALIHAITIASALLISPIGLAASAAVLTAVNKKNAEKIYKAEYGYMINLLCGVRRIDFNRFIGVEDNSSEGTK